MYLDLFVKRVYGDGIAESLKGKKSVEEKINALALKGVSKLDLVEKFEDYYNCKYIDPLEVDLSEEILKYIDLPKLIELNIYPFDYNAEAKTIKVAYTGLNTDLGSMFKALNLKVEMYYSFDFEIAEKLKSYTKEEPKRITKEVRGDIKISDDPVIWVTDIIDSGIRQKASDIHIEIKKEYVIVRYRIDGALTVNKKYNFTDSDKSKIANKIKTIAGLDISEKRRPQDGRVGDHTVDGMRYDLRVSTLSTVAGEKIVLRVVDKDSPILSFEELGFDEEDIKKIKKALSNQNGIIYIGGATGSGKTTTLYTMIKEKDTEDINIYSVENPVEKEIETINQVQINPAAGISYATTLRSLLRQDPDVMVIGEIRDIETAELSLNASLAGHLILTTIHANNALDTLNRLYELGLEPYLVSSSSLLLMSQRLIRPLCDCKEKYEIDETEKDWIESIIKANDLDMKIEDFNTLYKEKGCERCGTGYIGRYAIAETLEVTESIANMIHRKANINEIKEVAIKEQQFKTFGSRILKDIKLGRTSVKEAMSKIN